MIDKVQDIKCPHCSSDLNPDDLEKLKCPDCGEELPPRLGI